MSLTNLTLSLKKHIQAGCPGIYLQTAEESRVDALLKELTAALGLRRIQEWNLGHGWVKFEGKQPVVSPESTKTELEHCLLSLLDEELEHCLILIKGAKSALENNNLAIARLKQLLNRIERHHAGECVVILVSEAAYIPPSLESQLTLLPLPLPSREEIASQLQAFVQDRGLAVPEVYHSQLLSVLSGLGEREIQQVLNMVLAGQAELTDDHLQQLRREKEQVIAKSGVLEMVKTDVKLDDIGGLENLKQWLRQRAKILHTLEQAAKQGVKAPKGVLIAGMPGCGKSLTAKVTAQLFQLPLLRLDIGSLLGKYVGESEHNMRRALSMAETVSPCVLWVDELEKAFVGMGSGNASEVTSRLLGYFLTWMQEKTGAVFVIATANDISALPAELLRKGRFDEIFYVGFPNAQEREAILRIYLSKAPQPIAGLEMQTLVGLCRDYTGADIENAVNEALTNAFVEDKPLDQGFLSAAIQATIPLRETLRDQIGKYEELFEKLKLRPASEYQGLSVAQMIRMVDDPNQVKREEVASNPDCPEDLLERLAEDRELSVVEAVYKNPRCPERLLSKRINLTQYDQAYNEHLLLLACLHERLPVDLLSLKIKGNQLPQKVIDGLSDTRSHGLQLLVAKEFFIEHKRKLAANAELAPEVQALLVDESVYGITQALAANKSITAETVEKLIKQRRSARRYFVQHRPDIAEQWRQLIEWSEAIDPLTENHLKAIEMGLKVSDTILVADNAGSFSILTFSKDFKVQIEMVFYIVSHGNPIQFNVELGEFVEKGDKLGCIRTGMGDYSLTAPISGRISALADTFKDMDSPILFINPV